MWANFRTVYLSRLFAFRLQYSIVWRISPVTLFLLASSVFAQQPPPRVVSSGRGWYQGKILLLRDATVEPNVPLVSTKDTGDLILDCGNRGWWLYHCNAESCMIRPCAESSDKSVNISRPLMAHITEMLGPLVRRERAELAVAGVRGSSGVSDAVVLQTAQGIHWGPALSRVLEGHYCFRLSRLPPGSEPVRTFTLDWDRSVEKEGIAVVPNLVPGLFALAQGVPGANASCAVDANAVSAWVLIVPQAAFEQVDEQWQEDSSQVDDLEQSGASTSAVTTLRHAILAWLADSAGSK